MVGVYPNYDLSMIAFPALKLDQILFLEIDQLILWL